jgi:hypothetical protein
MKNTRLAKVVVWSMPRAACSACDGTPTTTGSELIRLNTSPHHRNFTLVFLLLTLGVTPLRKALGRPGW